VPDVSFISYPSVETFQFVSAITVSRECGRRQAPVGELGNCGVFLGLGVDAVNPLAYPQVIPRAFASFRAPRI